MQYIRHFRELKARPWFCSLSSSLSMYKPLSSQLTSSSLLCWLTKRRADEMASWRKETAPFKTNFLRKSHGDHPPRLYSYFNHDIVAKVAQCHFVNLPFRLHAVLSICQFINMPFCLLAFSPHIVLYQFGISSSPLCPLSEFFFRFNNFCQFINLLFLVSVVLSICKLIILTAHQLVIFSSCCFDNLSFHQVVNLSFSYILFHKFAISSACQFINLWFCQYDVFSNCIFFMFVNLDTIISICSLVDFVISWASQWNRASLCNANVSL